MKIYSYGQQDVQNIPMKAYKVMVVVMMMIMTALTKHKHELL
jgi:hypothetical protein